MVDLGTLPGENFDEPFQSEAMCINDAGVVFGASHYTDVNPFWWHAFRWVDVNGNGQSDPNEMVDLGTLGGLSSWANAINNRGVIAGASNTATGELHAVTYTDSAGMVDLGTFVGCNWSVTNDISYSGIVVGSALYEYVYPYDRIHACMWINGQINDLGTLGGTQSAAWAINDKGVIVGESMIVGDAIFHAFVYDSAASNQMIDIGAVEPNASSYAYAINNYGVIVGEQVLSSINRQHAAMYVAGEWIDLQQTYFPTYDSSVALDISDNGWIVGTGVNGNGETRGWVLKLEYTLKGDFNKDGIVDFKDFAIMVGEWLQTEPWYAVGE